VHDIRLLREDPQALRDGLRRRGVLSEYAPALDRAEALERERRALIQQAEEKKAARNAASQEVARRKKAKEDAGALIAETRTLGDAIAALEQRLADAERELEGILLAIPNLVLPAVPDGGEESNRVVRSWGEPRAAAGVVPHWEIGEKLGILDLAAGAKLTGSGFIVLKGAGARLSRAIMNFMLDLHTREHGYTEVEPPFLVNGDALRGTGNLPKFEQDLFKIAGEWDLYLIPTAEVPLTNLHRGEILDGRQLPLRYTAYTPCFLSEAGSYGADVRGLIRQHQFDKVELVKITSAESSYEELEKLTANAEEVLKRLELPYRTVLLCTGDMGFASAKTYDIEVWLPSQNTYREISSCSNTEAFQARRAGIKVRPQGTGKAEFAHTLNGSGLAVGRTLIAILENGQQQDGSVVIPPALRPYMRGVDVIRPR
jgi:seryl-tRNA synthetase